MVRGLRRRRRGRAVVVVVLGLALTVLLSVTVRTSAGVYDGQLQLAMFLPPRSAGSNPLAVNSTQAILFASVVERKVSGVRPPPRLTSQSISLAEQGIRTGVQLRMYNGGGQWANDFSRPYLRIEAVGSSERSVRAQLARMAEQVRRTADDLQEEQGVARPDRVTITAVPSRAQVEFESTRSGLAAVLTLLTGSLLTAAAASAVLRRGRQRA